MWLLARENGKYDQSTITLRTNTVRQLAVRNNGSFSDTSERM